MSKCNNCNGEGTICDECGDSVHNETGLCCLHEPLCDELDFCSKECLDHHLETFNHLEENKE